MVGKHAIRKAAHLPNRTGVRWSLIPLIKAFIHHNLFVQVPHQFDAFFNPNNASEKSAKNITPPSIGQLEKRTSSLATDVVSYGTLATMATTYVPIDSSLWRGPAFHKARAPQGRSSGSELQNYQNSGLALRDANTTMRAFERFSGSTIGLG